LIATVLLIGFTIVLAALVIQWGGDLFKTFQSQTGVSSEVSQTCAVGLSNLEIKKAISYTDKLGIVIDNRNDVVITKFSLRIYQIDGTAKSYTSNKGLGKGELSMINFTTSDVVTTGTQLGITPWITATADGKEYMCPKEITYTA
jgi:FlaG/FlaF family flagellin (archaellin)